MEAAWLDAVIDIARRAGREILDVYGTDFEAGGFWTVVGATIVIWLVNVVIAAAMHDLRRR